MKAIAEPSNPTLARAIVIKMGTLLTIGPASSDRTHYEKNSELNHDCFQWHPHVSYVIQASR